MGMFDDLKKRMDKFANEVQKAASGTPSGGQRLGASETMKARFAQQGPLGMKVAKGAKGEATVSEVTKGGPAAAAGIQLGDVVVRVGDVVTASYDAFFPAIHSAGRPVELGISRPALHAATRLPASDGEREARRNAQAKAALERDGAWSKRVASRPQGGRYADKRPVQTSDETKSTNPETLAAWKAAEARAEAEVQSLGYDPFKSVSSGSAGARPANPQDAPAAADSGPGRRLGSADEMTEYAAAKQEAEVVVDALVAHPDVAQVGVCIATVLKLLDNAATKDDEKFRRVRLANAAVQTKVLAVPGGLEALCAAGFGLTVDDNDETILLLSKPTNKPKLAAVTDALNTLKAQLAAAS